MLITLMPTRYLIGLNAGPSADGVDAVLLELVGHGASLQTRLICRHTEPFPREFRERLLKASVLDQADVRHVSITSRMLGEAFAQATQHVANRASMSLQQVLCVGLLGHTAWHDGGSRAQSTLRLGSPAVVAERTGLTTVHDFRERDLAAGGQGSPIGASADQILFQSDVENRLLIHLGGLAHIVYLPARSTGVGNVLGWESGPCTVLLDALVREATAGKEQFDTGGRLAVQGRVIPELLSRWANHPFLIRKPPKSTHRSVFAESFARQTIALAQQMNWTFHDLICTANHFIVTAIIEGLGLQSLLTRRASEGEDRASEDSDSAGIHRVLLSGGGVRNGLLWRLLEEQLPEAPMQRTDEFGVPADVREAAHAAILAALTLDGVPANAPSVTGASGARLLGSLTPGAHANWTRCLAWMAAQRAEVAIPSHSRPATRHYRRSA